jgi:DNA-binding YbaB/EbfC family protein
MNVLKLLGNLGNLAKIQEELHSAIAELANESFEGRAGGDMVVIHVNGAQQLTGCAIDPKLMAENDRELIEELVVAAVNDALNVAKRRSAEILQQKLGDRLDLPGLSGLLGNLMPKA